MSYMVTTTKNINNGCNINNITDINTDNSNYYLIEPFRRALDPLIEQGWQIVKYDSNIITLNKVFHELEEISIEYSNNQYHFTLPINNSVYSYYRKICNFYGALTYLELYVNMLC